MYCLPSVRETDACPCWLATKNKDKARSVLVGNFADISVIFMAYINQTLQTMAAGLTDGLHTSKQHPAAPPC